MAKTFTATGITMKLSDLAIELVVRPQVGKKKRGEKTNLAQEIEVLAVKWDADPVFVLEYFKRNIPSAIPEGVGILEEEGH